MMLNTIELKTKTAKIAADHYFEIGMYRTAMIWSKMIEEARLYTYWYKLSKKLERIVGNITETEWYIIVGQHEHDIMLEDEDGADSIRIYAAETYAAYKLADEAAE